MQILYKKKNIIYVFISHYLIIKRSEERRVGKECRSECDWSSDVCSSDLNF